MAEALTTEKPVSKFDLALNFTLKWEGGYVNDPKDPGGETNFGISKRAYPNEDIKNLTRERARDIYIRDYWNPLVCSSRDRSMGIAVFDSAVNCGVARVMVWLDGAETWEQLLQCRRNYYQDLVKRRPALKRYLKGWLNRLDALTEFIKKLEVSDQRV